MKNHSTKFAWTVIGAGPAGIAAIGKLMDANIDPNTIAWIDPAFCVGDFGSKWHKVPSNTKVSSFLNFLNAANAFGFTKCQPDLALKKLDPNHTCTLDLMGDALQWVTEQLKTQVTAISALACQLQLQQNHWEIQLANNTLLYSKNVILAIGSEPRSLPTHTIPIIPLATALNTEQLAQACSPDDTVAVFGSSHSAILILRNLIETCHVKKIINFYQSPLRFAVDLGDMVLFNDTGLKGTTADWARENIHGQLPNILQRILVSDAQAVLAECTKAIYAIGFKKRTLAIKGFHELHHNPHNGIIAPGLFGLGIAFPEAKIDRFGYLEHRVGLWKFMEYLTTVLPVWLQYPV